MKTKAAAITAAIIFTTIHAVAATIRVPNEPTAKEHAAKVAYENSLGGQIIELKKAGL